MSRTPRTHCIALFTLLVASIGTAASSIASAQVGDARNALPAVYLLLFEELIPNSAPQLADINGAQNLFVGVPISPIIFSNSGGHELTGCSVAPPLPAELSVGIHSDGLSCEIVGTPSGEQSPTAYMVTATNEFGSDAASVTLAIGPGMISVTGQVTFDLVPTTSVGGEQLDYENIQVTAAKAVTVELLSGTGSVLQTTTTDQNGEYQFSVASNAMVRVRVRAELLKNSGEGQYDVRVVDNTNAGALYTLAEPAASQADANPQRNLHAASGWDLNSESYTGTRAAAPFAMLDSIYQAISDVLVVDPEVILPPLTVNWSINNRAVGGNPSAGDIGTSFYSANNLFILGAANSDTDEYDDHVVIHEWGHYFEDNLSRSDSIGGPHGFNDRLDMRVAFGEGFGNALAGIITDDPVYIDTFGSAQSSGFSINVENNPSANTLGWYNESSVQSILYDLYDANDDGPDAVTLGLAPLYEVLVNAQRTTPWFTSIFTFIDALKTANPGAQANIDQIVNAQAINGTAIDARGSNETNDADSTPHVLPVFTDLTPGVVTNICTNTEFNGSSFNKLSNHRYLAFTLPVGGEYEFSLTRTSAPAGYGNSDPDFEIYLNGVREHVGFSGTQNSESNSAILSAGFYVMAVTDYNILFGADGIACFDVLINEAN